MELNETLKLVEVLIGGRDILSLEEWGEVYENAVPNGKVQKTARAKIVSLAKNFTDPLQLAKVSCILEHPLVILALVENSGEKNLAKLIEAWKYVRDWAEGINNRTAPCIFWSSILRRVVGECEILSLIKEVGSYISDDEFLFLELSKILLSHSNKISYDGWKVILKETSRFDDWILPLLEARLQEVNSDLFFETLRCIRSCRPGIKMYHKAVEIGLSLAKTIQEIISFLELDNDMLESAGRSVSFTHNDIQIQKRIGGKAMQIISSDNAPENPAQWWRIYELCWHDSPQSLVVGEKCMRWIQKYEFTRDDASLLADIYARTKKVPSGWRRFDRRDMKWLKQIISESRKRGIKIPRI